MLAPAASAEYKDCASVNGCPTCCTHQLLIARTLRKSCVNVENVQQFDLNHELSMFAQSLKNAFQLVPMVEEEKSQVISNVAIWTYGKSTKKWPDEEKTMTKSTWTCKFSSTSLNLRYLFHIYLYINILIIYSYYYIFIFFFRAKQLIQTKSWQGSSSSFSFWDKTSLNQVTQIMVHHASPSKCCPSGCHLCLIASCFNPDPQKKLGQYFQSLSFSNSILKFWTQPPRSDSAFTNFLCQVSLLPHDVSARLHCRWSAALLKVDGRFASRDICCLLDMEWLLDQWMKDDQSLGGSVIHHLTSLAFFSPPGVVKRSKNLRATLGSDSPEC